MSIVLPFTTRNSLDKVTAEGVQWPSGRVSDSKARRQGFNTYLRHVVYLSKDTFLSEKFRPMTEKLLTGMLSTHCNCKLTAEILLPESACLHDISRWM